MPPVGTSRHSQRSIWIKNLLSFLWFSVQFSALSLRVCPTTSGEWLRCDARRVRQARRPYSRVRIVCVLPFTSTHFLSFHESTSLDVCVCVCSVFLFVFIEPNRTQWIPLFKRPKCVVQRKRRKDEAVGQKKMAQTRILRKMVTNFIKRNRLEIIQGV